MNGTDVKDLLVGLRQFGMARSFEAQLANRAFDGLSKEEFVGHMCFEQIADNDGKSLARLKKIARFKYDAQPEEIIWNSERGLDKSAIRPLLTGDWIRRTENILMSGAAGTGKTWLACALGLAAIRQHYSVRYMRTNPLLDDMRRAHVDGTIGRMRKNIAHPKLLILDDFGISPISEAAKEDLFEILEARTDCGSTMILGQLAPSEWHAYLSTVHLADAIMDRVVQRAHQIHLRGDSLRKRL